MKNSKISLPTKQIDLLIVIDLILMALALWLIQATNIDLEIQKYFFNFENKTWLIDKEEPIKKFIFYIFPKIVFGAGVLGCLLGSITVILDAQHRGPLAPNSEPILKKSSILRIKDKRLFLILLSLVLIPLIAGNIKKFTNVYCPSNLEIYSGEKPYVKIFDSYPANFHQIKPGKCFPAGHCLIGFSLMILFFALRKKSQRILGLVFAVLLGWITGFYQIIKGAHFFGDTLISMLICFFLAALIARIYSNFQEYD